VDAFGCVSLDRAIHSRGVCYFFEGPEHGLGLGSICFDTIPLVLSKPGCLPKKFVRVEEVSVHGWPFTTPNHAEEGRARFSTSPTGP
jgi:hypothetical protein